MLSDKFLKIGKYNKHFKKNKNDNSLKRDVFDGKLIIFKNVDEIKEIVNRIKIIYDDLLYPNRFETLANEFSETNELKINERKILLFQKKIKSSLSIRQLFFNFLKKINFKDSTFFDQICIRFIYKKKKLGNLRFVKAHRDTWASNLYEQINWWFPVNDLGLENTIYICPNYFRKKVQNNSSIWTYKRYLKCKKNSSTPISTKSFKSKEKILININPGDILCFSGHHIHGSNPGNNLRISMETRSVTLNDINKYNIPENVDGEVKEKKTMWFKDIKNKKTLSIYY